MNHVKIFSQNQITQPAKIEDTIKDKMKKFQFEDASFARQNSFSKKYSMGSSRSLRVTSLIKVTGISSHPMNVDKASSKVSSFLFPARRSDSGKRQLFSRSSSGKYQYFALDDHDDDNCQTDAPRHESSTEQ